MDFLNVLLIVSVGIIVLLTYLYVSLKKQIPKQAEAQYLTWREKDIILIQQEQMEAARREALSYAQKEAATQAQNLYQDWCRRELERFHEIARNDANAQLQQWKNEHEKSIKQRTVKSSRSVLMGQVTEQLMPYLPDFREFNPKDARFLGQPIDFIVFKGVEEGQVTEVIFVEVKTGSAKLNEHQKQIKKVIKDKKVDWRELSIDYGKVEYTEHQLILSESKASQHELPLHIPTAKETSTTPIREYSIIESYEVDEMISHHTFGIGKVVKVDGSCNKIEVSFSNSVKLLSHSKR